MTPMMFFTILIDILREFLTQVSDYGSMLDPNAEFENYASPSLPHSLF